MLERLPTRTGGAPPPFVPPKTAKLKPGPVAAAVLVVLVLLAPGASAVYSARNIAPATTGFQANYNLSLVTLPNFNPLSAYVDNYRIQYPTIAFAGPCAGGVLYVDNFSNLACFDPYGGDVKKVAGPLTLLYQSTPGLAAQIDNEYQLDTPNAVALFYGNLTTSPGFLTVETADLSNGSIHQVTTPVQMANDLQADYVGHGDVVVLNSTGIGGEPAYFVNVYNGTSWPAGLSIGIAADNIYWVGALNAFLDVQGVHLTEFQVVGNSLVATGGIYFNHTGLSSVSAVFGSVYQPGTVAFDLITNLGSYVELAHVGGGGHLVAAGSSAYLTPYVLAAQRYAYTTPYVWANAAQGAGATLLFDPFTNATVTTPGLACRLESSGANGNFELTDPYSSSISLSLNGSLVGRSSLAPNQFVWAHGGIPPPPNATTLGGAFGSTILGVPEGIWFAGALVIGVVLFGFELSRRDDT